MAISLSSAMKGLSTYAPLINAGVNLYAANRANKSANSNLTSRQDQYDTIEGIRLALALENNQRADDLINRYNTTFVPLQDRAISLASRRINPDTEAGLAGADVEGQVAVQQGALRRNLGRAGVAPNDPAAIAAANQFALSAGLGRAGAMTSARRNAADIELQRTMLAAQMGNSLPGQASSFIGLSNTGLADILARRGANLNQAEQLAMAGGEAKGNAIGDILGSLFQGGADSAAGKLISSIFGTSAAGTAAVGAPAAGALSSLAGFGGGGAAAPAIGGLGAGVGAPAAGELSALAGYGSGGVTGLGGGTTAAPAAGGGAGTGVALANAGLIAATALPFLEALGITNMGRQWEVGNPDAVVQSDTQGEWKAAGVTPQVQFVWSKDGGVIPRQVTITNPDGTTVQGTAMRPGASLKQVYDDIVKKGAKISFEEFSRQYEATRQQFVKK